jgi:ATP-dependent Clp protease ATP-binding subunit ClpA
LKPCSSGIPSPPDEESLRKEIERRSAVGEEIRTSVEIPFSAEAKRVLELAVQEADRLRHSYIGTEHLLLGLLREPHSVAASILTKHGVRLDDVRAGIVKLVAEPSAEPSSPVDVPAQIERIILWAGELVGMTPDNTDAHGLAVHIRDSLEELKRPLAE